MVQPQRKKSDVAATGATVPGRAWLMLALATVGFAVNFWACAGTGVHRAVARRAPVTQTG